MGLLETKSPLRGFGSGCDFGGSGQWQGLLGLIQQVGQSRFPHSRNDGPDVEEQGKRLGKEVEAIMTGRIGVRFRGDGAAGGLLSTR